MTEVKVQFSSSCHLYMMCILWNFNCRFHHQSGLLYFLIQLNAIILLWLTDEQILCCSCLMYILKLAIFSHFVAEEIKQVVPVCLLEVATPSRIAMFSIRCGG